MKNKKVNELHDMDYKSKRKFLRKFASNPEIEEILDIMVDEILVPNGSMLYKLDLSGLDGIIDDDEIKFLYGFKNKIFEMYGIDGITIYQYLRTFLIDGYLAFEIIYDEKATKIIGFKELDPTSLRPDLELRNRIFHKVWIQYDDNEELRRVLTDSQVIYISYAKHNYSKTSYVESLVRSFKYLRMMEDFKVIRNLSSDIVDMYNINIDVESDIRYFKDKLIRDSRIPDPTFKDNKFSLDEKEELRFARFKEKILSKFQEIFIKPLWIQFCIEYPQFQHNETIKQNLKITYL